MRCIKVVAVCALLLVIACGISFGAVPSRANTRASSSAYLLMDSEAQNRIRRIHASGRTDMHQVQVCGDSISESGYFLSEYFHLEYGESRIKLEVEGQPPLSGDESQTAASGETASFCINGWGDPSYRSGLVDVVLDSQWRPALATIMFGTNDLMVLFREELPWADDPVACERAARRRYIDQMRANAQWLIDRGIIPVFLSFIPVTGAAEHGDYSLTYEAHHNTSIVGRELNVVWRNALYRLADEMNVPVFDAYRLFADNNPDSLTDDGVHPNIAGYSLLNREFEKVYRDLGRVLSQRAESTWYLAEGTCAWGFSTYISVANPNTGDVTARVTYMTAGGEVDGGTLVLPAGSQTTITNDAIVQAMGGRMDFSTRVESTGGQTIAVDRTMEWQAPGSPSPEGHNSVGANYPATTWYLPEGSSNWDFETWLLVQNPNPQEVNCTVTYMIEGEGPRQVEHALPASGRASFSMADDIGAKDASIQVECASPVIAERAMYRTVNGVSRREGHCSIGTTTLANSCYLSEGACGWQTGFITYVLVQNPQDSSTDVNVTYLTAAGAVQGPSFIMEPGSRKTIRVNDQLPPDTDVATTVTGSQPIVAERAMYWGANTPPGEACHDSIGLFAPRSSFYLPDGQTSEGRETWTLVSNPNDSEVTVQISYLTPGGEKNTVFQETVPASSRRSFNMADKGVNGRAAVMVACKTAGKKIMCERAMYWNSRGAGTDTVGAYAE